jgi:hypothetical protein
MPYWTLFAPKGQFHEAGWMKVSSLLATKAGVVGRRHPVPAWVRSGQLGSMVSSPSCVVGRLCTVPAQPGFFPALTLYPRSAFQPWTSQAEPHPQV